MRTKAQIHCLSGHTNTVAEVRCQAAEPQVCVCMLVSHSVEVSCWLNHHSFIYTVSVPVVESNCVLNF